MNQGEERGGQGPMNGFGRLELADSHYLESLSQWCQSLQFFVLNALYPVTTLISVTNINYCSVTSQYKK